jgi:hypothetical protein
MGIHGKGGCDERNATGVAGVDEGRKVRRRTWGEREVVASRED